MPRHGTQQAIGQRQIEGAGNGRGEDRRELADFARKQGSQPDHQCRGSRVVGIRLAVGSGKDRDAQAQHFLGENGEARFEADELLTTEPESEQQQANSGNGQGFPSQLPS
jgi:hypothetical protein